MKITVVERLVIIIFNGRFLSVVVVVFFLSAVLPRILYVTHYEKKNKKACFLKKNNGREDNENGVCVCVFFLLPHTPPSLLAYA